MYPRNICGPQVYYKATLMRRLLAPCRQRCCRSHFDRMATLMPPAGDLSRACPASRERWPSGRQRRDPATNRDVCARLLGAFELRALADRSSRCQTSQSHQPRREASNVNSPCRHRPGRWRDKNHSTARGGTSSCVGSAEGRASWRRGAGRRPLTAAAHSLDLLESLVVTSPGCRFSLMTSPLRAVCSVSCLSLQRDFPAARR